VQYQFTITYTNSRLFIYTEHVGRHLLIMFPLLFLCVVNSVYVYMLLKLKYAIKSNLGVTDIVMINFSLNSVYV